MNKTPLVSVIMGVYNCEDTLEEAVSCIVNQTYNNWELIMCDDASTDNTYKIAKRISEKDNRIIILKNEKNLTLAPTLNKCLSCAKGKYIARMDGDDFCDKTRFEKEIHILENNKDFSIVSCNMNLFDTNGVYRTIHYKKYPVLKDFLRGSQFCHAGCMIRTDAIKAMNGYNESNKYKRVEDYDLWVRMCIRGYKGINIPEALYSMRSDQGALKRRTISNRVNESRIIYQVCKTLKHPLKNYLYVLIPIIKLFMPNFIYKKYYFKRNKKRN